PTDLPFEIVEEAGHVTETADIAEMATLRSVLDLRAQRGDLDRADLRAAPFEAVGREEEIFGIGVEQGFPHPLQPLGGFASIEVEDLTEEGFAGQLAQPAQVVEAGGIEDGPLVRQGGGGLAALQG